MHTATVRAILCALALQVAMCTPIVSEFDEASNLVMGTPPHEPEKSDEAVSQDLVNGGLAYSDMVLEKGPKVDGDIAINVPVRNDGPKRLSNADCAGHIVNGRCLKPFPRRSRTATIADNMESPEQVQPSAFEPDLHAFVRTHFNQEVMEETAAAARLAGFPGMAIMDREMNKESDLPAQSASDSLFPVGTGLMTHNDSEMPVDLNHVMGQKDTSFSSMNTETPALEKVDTQQAITDTNPIVAVKPEADLPPTPTPTPTPDPQILQLQFLAQEAHAKQIAVCVELLEKEGIDASSRASMIALNQVRPAKTLIGAENGASPDCLEPVTAVQTGTKATGPAKPAFDPTNVKQNLQNLVIFCINKATKELDTAVNGANDDMHLTVQRSTRFSQSLVKYANAMTCADSEDFPGCMPSEAEKLVKQGPVNGEWSCF